MRRLIATVPMLALLVLAPSACKTRKKPRLNPAEDDGQLVSVINVADPRAAVQLTRGFYALESDAWRWTMKKFAVTLRRPTGAAENGARLELKFVLPETIFNRVGPITISAIINGLALPPQTYSTSGDGTYARDVPASALTADAVAIEFSVDKGLPPSDQDARELAIIVTTIGLLPK